MTPLLLIKPIIWLFSAIMTVLVALFSAITGNYYAAIPRDGGQTGVVAYLPSREASDSGILSIQLASGMVFHTKFSSIRPLNAGQSQLLGPATYDHALALAMLSTDIGDEMRCEFAIKLAGRSTTSGVCRDSLGRLYDLQAYPVSMADGPPKPSSQKITG